MKQLRLLVIGMMALTLVGCESLGGFGSRVNPITKNDLDKAKLTYRVVLDAAVTYRDLCDRKVMARATCAPVVARLEAADDKVQIALRNLSKFVKDHPTVDAISLVIAVKDAVQDFMATANQYGVK